jgi:HPt (histidine-containing phosphotransfer) domain-containing protein
MDQGAFGHGSSPQLPILTLTGEDSSGTVLAAAPASERGLEPQISVPGPSAIPDPAVIVSGVLDRRELLARVDGNRALLAELVRLFEEERPELLEAMEAALRDGSAHDLARAAHKVKGACGNLSAPLAQQAAAELEQLADRGELALATDAYLRLSRQIERLEAELRALMQDDRAA